MSSTKGRLAILLAFGLIAPARADDPKARPVLEMSGYLVPARQAQVSPAVAGQVVQVMFQEGQQVKRGEVLVKLDDAPHRVELLRAEAVVAEAQARLVLLKAGSGKEAIDQAKAEVEAAEAQRKFREAALERLRRGPDTVPQRGLDQAQRELETARAKLAQARAALERLTQGPRPEEVAVAEARLRQAQADVERAKYVLQQTTITAPFAGTILARRVDVGSYVNPDGLKIGASICQLADLRNMEVEVDVAERDLAKIVVGQECRIRADAIPNRVYNGKVARLLPIANRAKGTVGVRVRVEIPEKDDNLRPEMRTLVSFLPRP
jgi:multidrug resistance efflux pump